MKTKGILFARAKNALSILSFLAVIPASAQLDFASQRDVARNSPYKVFTTNFVSSYSAVEPTAKQYSAVVLPTSLGATESKSIDNAAKLSSNDLPALLNSNSLNEYDLDISFKPTSFTYPSNCKADVGIDNYSTAQVILYAKALKQYAIEKGFDTSYVFLSNMAIASDKKRFFIINLTSMQIEHSGLVAQGRGMGKSRYDKQYSDQKGSRCTSLGRYKIMSKYRGEYGESYRLAGLDTSNENAYDRNVVLHPMGCIPDEEDIMGACISEGCPAVSVKFLTALSKIIDSRQKPLLLWIFDSNLEEVVVKQKPKTIVTEPGYSLGDGYHQCTMHIHNDAILQ
ncbi:MAG: murein L,D-transpeptidase catalytic domain-containing protein [Chitinophagaceae bacterium]